MFRISDPFDFAQDMFRNSNFRPKADNWLCFAFTAEIAETAEKTDIAIVYHHIVSTNIFSSAIPGFTAASSKLGLFCKDMAA